MRMMPDGNGRVSKEASNQDEQQQNQQPPTTKVTSKIVIPSFSLRHGVFVVILLGCMIPSRGLFSIQASIQASIQRGFDMDTSLSAANTTITTITTTQIKAFQRIIPTSCSFRQYGQHRLYGLTASTYPPLSLKTSAYIHGEPPIVLAPSSTSKLCAALTSDIVNEYTMDGSNPSILSLQHLGNNNTIYNMWKQHYPTAKYLVSMTFKANHQCTYNYNRTANTVDWKVPETGPLLGRKAKKEADIVLLDEHFQTLATTTVTRIMVNQDKPPASPSQSPSQSPEAIARSMDDSRLILHDDQIWISYIMYGPGRGRIMFMSRLEMSIDQDTKEWNAIATNQIALLYGRNLGALQQHSTSTPHHTTGIQQQSQSNATAALSVLAWPDPIWVQTIHIPKSAMKQSNKSTTGKLPDPKKYILENPDTNGKSAFHGTSNTLIYLPQYDEYLGIGHFHRKIRDDPRRAHGAYGHHYTHAFFTFGKIQDDQTSNATSAANQANNDANKNNQGSVTSPNFELRKISQEFVLSSQLAGYENDGDVIQFASGLEVVYGDETSMNSSNVTRLPTELIIGYGINDCEGAISVIKWSTVDEMLRAVSTGTEVRHTMKQVPEWIEESETPV